MATPDITLAVNLDDLSGNQLGDSIAPAKIRITLCGFGPTLPRIPATTMLAKTGPFDTLYQGALANIKLWGNDQIAPSGTFYSIEILDVDDNVVQCGAYRFTGGPQTIDLSTAPQILPPYGFNIGFLAVRNTTGVYPGTVYQAPGFVVMVMLNGVPLDPNASPTPDYTLSLNNTHITLSFTTATADKINALCIV